MSDHRLKQIFAILSFAIAFFVYLSTVAPTVSFWDCGEFIATAYTQAVPHPPGSPLFLIIARIFTLIPSFLIEDIALRVNIISVISSAFTVLFTFLIIVRFLQWMNGKKEDSEENYIHYFGAFVGAMVFAFSDSFWFNAVEAEVYAASMFFTAIIVWMIMRWGDHHDEPGNERYLILIAYLNGLAIGVHLLNILALPFIVYIVYFRKYKFSWNGFWSATGIGVLVTGVIYIGIVKRLIDIPENFGFFGLFIFFIALLFLVSWAVKNKKNIVALCLASIVLIIIGYSSYGYIYIRSGLNPNIDENNPETIEKFIKYMDREQYGVSQGFTKDYLERKAPFWSYQINKMYVRYFAWQFLGHNDRTDQVDLFKFFLLPMLLGLFGAYRQYKKTPQYAFANFVLWFMTGLAIILYLNQPDPQPRERDYSYVGSFFAFALWVGIGASELIRKLKEMDILKSGPVLKLGSLVLLIVPAIMLAANYKSHDRSGNYVAWDYSYNMLQSCAPNSILFTNGDNDTFPLWYLQEVEGVRTDVRIANLSLLNTDWYIRQLRDLDPKIPINLSDRIIDRLKPRYWNEKDQEQYFQVDRKVVIEAQQLYNKEYPESRVDTIDTKISFKVPPTFGPGVKVSDLMMLRILDQTKLDRPVYYAVTVSPDNMLGSLRDYMRMDGLVFNVVPIKNWVISPTEIRKNMLEKYRYRNLNNPDVYYNNSTRALLQNYRSGFLHVTDYYLRHGRLEDAQIVLKTAAEKIPEDVIPFNNSRLKKLYTIFSIAAGLGDQFANGDDQSINRDVDMFGKSFIRENHFDLAANCFAFLANNQPANFTYLRQYVSLLQRNKNNTELKKVLSSRISSGLLDSTSSRWAKTILDKIDE